MFRAAAVVCFAAFVHQPVAAQPADALFDALRMAEIVEIMRDEGVAYSAELNDGFLGGNGGRGWDEAVAEIYDLDRMTDEVRSKFTAGIADEDIAPLLDYFTSEDGAEIIALEIEARRAMSDDDVEEAARAAVETIPPERMDRLSRFVDVNDLIESNLEGALNSNFAFLTGLSDGGAMAGELTETQIIEDVWNQAPEIRADTTEWLLGYLGLAYAPLSDPSLDAYLDLAETPSGQALNRAIFRAFDGIYSDISYELGQTAARFMQAEEI